MVSSCLAVSRGCREATQIIDNLSHKHTTNDTQKPEPKLIVNALAVARRTRRYADALAKAVAKALTPRRSPRAISDLAARARRRFR